MGGQAFQGRRGQHFFADANRVCVIGLAGREGSGPFDTSDKQGDHPLWDDRIDLPVDERMAQNMRVYGVIEAVKVRKAGKYPEGHPLEGEDIIEVVEGRQRTRSCRLAAKLAEQAGEVAPQLKIEFMKGMGGDAAVGIMISANEQRRDDMPHVRARKAARILALGTSVAAVANMFGVQEQSIRQWVKYLDLDKKVTKAVESQKLSFSAAVQLHSLPAETQREKLEELLASGVRPTVEAARDVSGAKPRKAGGARAPVILPKSKLKALATDQEFVDGLSDDAHALLAVILGDASAVAKVPGLTDRLSV